jgi:flagellar protein FlgJ
MTGLSSIPTSFSAGNADLEMLKSSSTDSSIADVAKKFEGVFMSMLLKTMRESMTDGEMFGGDEADIMGGIFDQYMGDAMSQSGGLGVVSQLAGSGAPGSAFSALM